MKPRIRAHYINLHNSSMRLLEQQAHKQVLRAYRKQKPRVIDFVRSGYSLDELLDHLPKFYKDSVRPLWAATLKQIWNNAAQEADANTREWLAPNALGAIKKAWEDSVDSWMQEHAGARIDGITDTDQEWLANTLRSGESEGKSTEEMASDLTETFDNMSEGRAGTIARTETAGAYNYASLDTAQDLMPDGSTKEWMTPYYQDDGRWKMANELRKRHPDVVRITRKFRRWQHHVDYRPFRKNKLIKKEGIESSKGIDNYGMVLKRDRNS